MARKTLPSPLQRTLREEFGFHALRAGQAEVIRAVLARRDILAVMPTGAGKSLCYQLPGLHLDGTTVIVSPLLSLIKDQHDKLRELGRDARRLDSTVPAGEEAETLAALAAGDVEFLFVTPERLAADEFLRRLKQAHVDFVVVDEAHCVSQWGHDFRPDYLEIGRALDALGRPPLLALTATAGPQVVADLREHLRSPELEVVETALYRPNLHLAVLPMAGDETKRLAVEEELRRAEGAGIVYTATVRHCDELTAHLRAAGFEVEAYHGRLPKSRRNEVQDRFMAGDLPAVVATNAFGMGIDKADLRFVLHYDLPGSLDAYYQEAGRAGREGQPARCTLLYDLADRKVQAFLLATGAPRGEDVPVVWDAFAAGDEAETGGHGASAGEVRELAVAGVVEASGLSRQRVRTALQALVRLGLVGRRRGRYRRIAEDLDPKLLAQLAREYSERREADRARLARMERYAQTALCRWANVLAYFADEAPDDPAWTCGHCDSCERPLPEEVRFPDGEAAARLAADG